MYPAVTEVVPGDGYMLSVVFDNGEKGLLDMKPFLNFGVFQRLKEQDVFNRVRISFDTVAWDGGIDLDPEFVYEECKMTTDMHATDVQEGASADVSSPHVRL